MKQTIILIIALLLCGVIYAQTDAWQWAQSAGGMGEDYGCSIATDSSGNTYVTGCFTATATFGTTSLINSSNSHYDIFIAKLDPSGNFLWAQQAGGANYDEGYGITTDSSGNSYVTGYFIDTATFGTTTLSSSGNLEIFIAKLDTNGNFLWAQQAGGTSTDYGTDIATDSSGNTYVTGCFAGTATFGTIALTSSGGHDTFVTKLDTNGNFIWAKQAGGTSHDRASVIATDSSGNSYISGYFFGTAAFGTNLLENSSNTYSDIFITKLDSAGNFLWAKQAGGPYNDYGNGIATDSSGNSYVTGFFGATATFGTSSLTSSGEDDIFVTKLDTNGNFLWAKQAGGTSYDRATVIATDSSGNSYVSGIFFGTATFGTTTLENSITTYSDIFITKLDSAGNFLWAKQAGGPQTDNSDGIAADSSGNSYVTGSFASYTVFDTISLTSSGYDDIFIAKLSADGVFVSDELISPAASISHLGNAYPNPFRAGASGTIKADVPDHETGVFTVYNLRGQVIQSQHLSAGVHKISVSTADLGPGIYFYRLKTPSLCEVKKLVVLK